MNYKEIIEILDTDIIDHNQDDSDDVELSLISVSVKIKYNDDIFYFDFQTTGTSDYGAISCKLEAYHGHSDYKSFENKFNNEDIFTGTLEYIKEKAGVQSLWENYVKNNFIKDEGYYGGLDANSEINTAKRK